MDSCFEKSENCDTTIVWEGLQDMEGKKQGTKKMCAALNSRFDQAEAKKTVGQTLRHKNSIEPPFKSSLNNITLWCMFGVSLRKRVLLLNYVTQIRCCYEKDNAEIEIKK